MVLDPITINTDTTIEVVSKYKELSVVLTDIGSIHIKAKETYKCNDVLYGLKW